MRVTNNVKIETQSMLYNSRMVGFFRKHHFPKLENIENQKYGNTKKNYLAHQNRMIFQNVFFSL